MSLKILIDMNLAPAWVPGLAQHGYQSAHWSSIGSSSADDAVIMAWALSNQHVVLTHDLDFGTLLALTHASGPSVIQLRTRSILLSSCFSLVVTALQKLEAELTAGAIVVIDEASARVRVLPL